MRLIIIALIATLYGCSSHDNDTKLTCKMKCVKCDGVELECSGTKAIEKIEVNSG